MIKFLDKEKSQELINLGIDKEEATFRYVNTANLSDEAVEWNRLRNTPLGEELYINKDELGYFQSDIPIFSIYDLIYWLEKHGNSLIDVLEDQNWNNTLKYSDNKELIDYLYNWIIKLVKR